MWDYAGLRLGIESKDLDDASKRARVFQGDVDNLERSTQRLARVAGAALGTLAAAFSVRALANYADAWSDMQSRVGAAIKDMEAAPELMRRMVEVANASYSPLDQTVETYARNVQVLKDLGYTAEETADFTESLNHMLVITATKGERAASVQNALSKAMALGKLQAEGLESVLANGGRVAEALAKELGTTVSGLRALASEGKITGEVIAKAIGGSLEEVREQAGEMPATIADGFTRINTGIQAFIGQLDQALGSSGSFANLLVAIGDAIAYVATADFGAVLNGVTDAVVTLGQALLVLATMRMTALLMSLRAVNVGLSLMTAQFAAGAAASRLMTIAMGAGAVAARGLSAALAFVGGPIGLVVGAVAALGINAYNTIQNVEALGETSRTMAERHGELATAIREMDNEMTEGSLQAARMAAEAQISLIETAIEQAKMALEDASFGTNFFGLSLYETEAMASLRASIEGLEGSLASTRDRLTEINAKTEAFKTLTAEAKGEAVALTSEQQKALATANEMLLTSQRRIELANIENRYGKESVAYKLQEYIHERDIYFAKVATLDVTNKVKDALRQSWMEEQTATGKTREWDAAMDILRGTADEALELIKTIGETEPGSTWLDTAIAKAAKLAGTLWDGVTALGELSSLELDAAGNPIIPGTKGKRPRPAPSGEGGIDWGLAPGGGGGGGGGADPMAERYKQLEETFRSEIEMSVKHYADDLEALKWALDTKKLTHEEYYDYLEQLRITTWGAEWEQTQLQRQMDQEALQTALEQKLISYEDYYRKLKELQWANLLSEDNRSDMAKDLANTAQYFTQLHSLTGSGFDGLLKLQRAFGAASALINAWQGYSEALANNPMMPPWMKLMWAGKILAAGLGAVNAIKGGGKGGGGSGGGAATTAASAAQTQVEQPLRVTLDAIDPNAQYSGAAIQKTFEEIQKEAGNRGIIWTTAGENG